MASPAPLSSCFTFLIFFAFTLFLTIPHATARLHAALFSTSSLVHRLNDFGQGAKEQSLHKIRRNSHSLAFSKVMKLVGELAQEDTGGVIRSTPARDMPAYRQRSAPTPLPEFPTLGPPIVWSFPAPPLPAADAAPPPEGIPAIPRTGGKNGGPPPACGGRDDGYHNGQPRLPPSVPYVAAEPAVMPGPLEAPEGAPEPTAGGPVLPPYY